MNFYPGPSKVYHQVKDWLNEAYETDILSIQHRSQKFMDIYESIVKNLQEKHNIPKDYTIVFTSSATECWHILNDSFGSNNFSNINSYHFFNGAFGKKWFDYRKANYPKTTFGIEFGINEELEDNFFQQIPQNDYLPNIICLCQNETSNTTQISQKMLSEIRQNRQNDFIFIDATSSWGGQNLNFNDADAWFTSVQKCFGLPAGLGIMALSPNLIDFYRKNSAVFPTNDIVYNRYNQLSFLIEKANQFQTTYTPNVLNIYLLSKVISFVPSISITSKKIEKRANHLYKFIERNYYHLLITNTKVRSKTVLAIRLMPEGVENIKKKAKKEDIILGNGYGSWKEDTLRIANFPQHTDIEFERLKEFLK
ncbi:serine-pyruvate aminotransferase/archaeal aspartate aminotransferase [Bernardetia litoralis DSM 6794]|uniref:Serine-pyruvate aminotransferase/archaeal aspartate aminotransferase n=1 Tax=Bernardetia litoralis (strain ATCC 23117 / DSM 6794 / NBRC 15988 / NCIMB 1366 / Fx l1 / Sio-4) TaxID=880071 RepID=I4AQ26_BERLS|nr:aminotransferase class V-fold PLP-dependent enzyme [Bernardetia litoralis]AFM06061.1 serine-pyruvate aminotransferase/archaeal aspartate aminotransferase [Bernardetia litoralis DSM 6794]